eukprot:2868856-Pleurochrysis_carterae.AAC.1
MKRAVLRVREAQMPGTSGGRSSCASRARGSHAGRARGDGGCGVEEGRAACERQESGLREEGGEVGGEGAASVKSMRRFSVGGGLRGAAPGAGRLVARAGMKERAIPSHGGRACAAARSCAAIGRGKVMKRYASRAGGGRSCPFTPRRRA